jgi:hypothetical protein
VNAKNAKEISVENVQLTWRNNRAMAQTSLRGVFKISMQFGEFPYDKQNLDIEQHLALDANAASLQLVSVRVDPRIYAQGLPGWTPNHAETQEPLTKSGVLVRSSRIRSGQPNGVDYSSCKAQIVVQRLHDNFIRKCVCN